jgi:hypothetical protein
MSIGFVGSRLLISGYRIICGGGSLAVLEPELVSPEDRVRQLRHPGISCSEYRDEEEEEGDTMPSSSLSVSSESASLGSAASLLQNSTP